MRVKATTASQLELPSIQPNSVYKGDCRDVLKTFPECCVSACITDPPYNYEFMGTTWNDDEISRRLQRIQSSKTLVKNIPYGSGLAGGVRNERWYRKNRENTISYQKWCEEWALELFRVCKAGAFVAAFSSTRSSAHVQVALEAAGFYARDVLVFRRHSGIPKGLNVSKKLQKTGHPDAAQWQGWHSCLRNEWEAIVLVQKPLLGNYIQTIEATGLGPMKAINDDGSFQSNILEGFQREESPPTEHCTVKPLSLIKRLIELLVPKGNDKIILDPFAGSGTTLLAAKQLGYSFVGVEIEPKYLSIIEERLNKNL